MSYFGNIKYPNGSSENFFGNLNFLGWSGGGAVTFPYIQASGGIETYAGGKKIHTFLAGDPGIFQVYSVPPSNPNVDYLIQAGGGSGCFGTSRGGGAAGGFTIEGTIAVTPSIYTFYAGFGGLTGTAAVGNNGENSTAFGFTATGGAKASRNGFPAYNGGNGGGVGNGISGAGGLGLQGFNGGDSIAFSSASGGGGSTQRGGDNGKGGVDGNGGDGGEGLASSISGTLVVYGSGASGSGNLDSGVPGTNAGKGGISNTTAPTAPVQNTGSGGASAYDLGSGTDGANGCVIVAYDWVGAPITYGLELTTLNSNIPSMQARDSAAYFPIDANTLGLFGGWNPLGVGFVNSQTFEWWTTTDGINFTQEADMPFNADHLVIGKNTLDNQIYLVGNDGNPGASIVSYKLDPITKLFTVINSDIGATIGGGVFYASWGFYYNNESFICVSPDGIACELWKSSDGNSWTFVSSLANYSIRSWAWVDGNTIRYGGGGNYNGIIIDNLIGSIYESTDGGVTWTAIATIDPKMKGLWPSIQKLGDRIIFIAGITFDTDNASREGAIWYSEDDCQTWYNSGINTLFNRHAIANIIWKNKMYLACGHLFNDSYNLSLNEGT